MTGEAHNAAARRALIAEIVDSETVRSQEELGELLAARGVKVTQATLSRDLLAVGAVKLSSADGRPRYALEEAAPRGDLGRVAGELLLRAEAAGNIAVLRTPPGAAQFLAGQLDRAKSFEPVGTVAGDDTIIIVMRTPAEAAELCSAMLRLAETRRTP